MALTIDLDVAIATDRESFTLTDSTVYGTGGNPARAGVAVYVTAYKTDVASAETELDVTGDDADPTTDSSWEIAYLKDGSYKINFSIIPDFDSGATYAQYDAVYSGGVVYRSLQASNTTDTLSDTDWWEVVDSPADLAENKDTDEESANITSQVYLRVLSADGQYTFATDLSNQSMYIDTDEEDQTLKNYNKFIMWLDAMAVADSRSEVIDGETIARKIESLYITY
jgi:hypothetical protein